MNVSGLIGGAVEATRYSTRVVDKKEAPTGAFEETITSSKDLKPAHGGQHREWHVVDYCKQTRRRAASGLRRAGLVRDCSVPVRVIWTSPAEDREGADGKACPHP